MSSIQKQRTQCTPSQPSHGPVCGLRGTVCAVVACIARSVPAALSRIRSGICTRLATRIRPAIRSGEKGKGWDWCLEAFDFGGPILAAPCSFMVSTDERDPLCLLLEIPLWLPLSVAAFLLVRAMRARPVCEGFCRTCEYNLYGNTSGVCPECGTATMRTTRA